MGTASDVIGLLEIARGHFCDKTALRTEDDVKKISYGELWQAVINTSSSLVAMGLNATDRVAILSENRPEWAVAFFGIIAAGARVVPLDTRLKENELAYIVNDSGASGIFFSERYLPQVKGLKETCGRLRLFISLDEVKDEIEPIPLAGMKCSRSYYRHQGSSLSDVATIIYTSGSTGFPKGVELTHSNLLFEAKAFSDILSAGPGDRILSFLPLNHALELICGLLGPLYSGTTITYLKDARPDSLLRSLAQIKPTMVTIVPMLANLMYENIIAEIKRRYVLRRLIFYAALSLSGFFNLFGMNAGRALFGKVYQRFGGALRCLICGGAPLDKKVARKLALMGITILEGYGLTEASPTVSVNTFRENRIGSVGKPLPGVEVRIVKEHPSDPAGEIITRGPHVMKGYLNNTERTHEAIRNGWLHTGDLGYLDKDGFLFVTGRLKNVIVTSMGKKVQPEEVENALLRHPLIREGCVVGRRISEGVRKGGEEVYAVVVPDRDYIRKEYGEVTEAQLQRLVGEAVRKSSGEIAGYKKITGFEIWENELPKTSTRKIRRVEILRQIRQRRNHETLTRR
ncbi:MAG: AMP-binding protein [Nitrospirota bacterium]|nr:AMP-binding protein [Nitrospirota bacterium]